MSDITLKIIKDTYDQWGRQTVNAILKEIDTKKIFWRGTLRRSISYSQPAPDEIQFNMADFGKFVDEGTGIFGPRKTPIPITKIPGIAFYLKPWADSKGLNNWAVATNIVKRGGTKPKPFFNSVIEKRVPLLGPLIETAITKALEDAVNNIPK